MKTINYTKIITKLGPRHPPKVIENWPETTPQAASDVRRCTELHEKYPEITKIREEIPECPPELAKYYMESTE